MKMLRSAIAIAAAVLFAVVLNAALVMERFFVWPVIVPLVLCIVCALVWSIWMIVLAVSSADRGKRVKGLSSAAGTAVFAGICLTLYAFAHRFDVSLDLTQEGRRELSEQTIRVLQSIDEDFQVYCLFLNIGSREIDTAKAKTEWFLKRCQQHTPYLTYTFMDPQVEKQRLEAMGMTMSRPEGTVVIRCGTRQRSVSLTGEPPRLEERDFTNSLINVTRHAQPNVYYLTGHGERADAALFRRILQSEAYQMQDFAVRIGNPSIPSDCDVLVINGLSAEMDPKEIQAIERYVDEGGRLLLMVDPVYARTGGPAPRMAILSWLENRFGIVVGDDLILSTIGDQFGVVDLVPDSAAVNMFSQYDVMDVEFLGCYSKEHPITRHFDQRMTLASARSVRMAPEPPSRVAGTEVLRTLPYAWAEKQLHVLAEPNPPPPKLDAGELQGSIGVGVAASVQTDMPAGESGRTRDARIVVIGDTDFTDNESVLYAGHLNFLLNAMAWLTEHEELIAIRAVGSENRPLRLTDAEERAVVWIATLGVLQVIVVAGAAAHVLRRRYQ